MAHTQLPAGVNRGVIWGAGLFALAIVLCLVFRYVFDKTLAAQLNQVLSGLNRGMMLFLIASGLSLIFGVMNILNFAHATLWLLGAYFCWFFWHVMESWGLAIWVAIPLAALCLAVIGFVIEVLLVRWVYKRELPEQLLLTYGLVLILHDLIKLVFTEMDRNVPKPAFLSRTIEIKDFPFAPEPSFNQGGTLWDQVFDFGGSLGFADTSFLFKSGDVSIASYNVFIIGAGVAVFIGLWLFLNKTRYGHIVRAAVFSREMVSALGIPIPMIYTGVFTMGILIAGLAGGIQAPDSTVSMGMDMHWIIQAFCVVVIGGFGSLVGTLVGSLIVGLVYALSIFIWPGGAMVLIFIVTAIVLIVRPWGLFGTPMRH
ncbi:MAG: branched-chain amino acid ABC transporter permease [Proteobacteria bacterium]|nr:branched-chain amino acid ABC transporter permease [Pseudomonadota bacterium]MBU1740674.1 branched-chain amino acid ABC transporter permease [Pseudomonadota bacterium]